MGKSRGLACQGGAVLCCGCPGGTGGVLGRQARGPVVAVRQVGGQVPCCGARSWGAPP